MKKLLCVFLCLLLLTAMAWGTPIKRLGGSIGYENTVITDDGVTYRLGGSIGFWRMVLWRFFNQ